MVALEQRIGKLEQRVMPSRQNVISIICKGATPTADEQAQIDEAVERGDFVIYHVIMPVPIAEDAQEGGVYGNA